MDVLVTGGSGMIGGYVVRELMAHQHQVTIFQPQSAAAGGRPRLCRGYAQYRAIEGSEPGQRCYCASGGHPQSPELFA